MLAVITLSFDPLLHVGELAVRWQTIGVTIAVLAALTVAALMTRRLTSPRPFFGPFPEAPVLGPNGEVAEERPLRLEDMVLIIAGIVPGAVIGGRLVHVIVYWDAYASAPLRIFDPSVGSLSLLGAVIGGLVTAAYVAQLLGAPIRRWADAAAVPLLLVIGLGKIAQLLGGSGQGLPFDGPWAVAFTGNGPWVSTDPQLPSHPSQLYEGIWALIGIPIVLRWAGPPRVQPRVNPLVAWADRSAPEGKLFVGALGWFLVGRILVGFTWRDAGLIGPLNGEQILALIALAGAVLFAQRGLSRPARRTVTAAGVAIALLATSVVPRPVQAAGVDARIAQMSTEEKVGQLFMVSFYGDTAAETDPTNVSSNQTMLGVDNAAQLISKYHVGGIVYFDLRGNLVSPRQTARLSNALQAAAVAGGAHIPLLISTDQEGGATVRLPAPAVPFPGNMALGATRDAGLARQAAAAMGGELRAIGINLDLAPVADVNVNPANPVIGVRSFGSDPALVAQMVDAQVRGLELDARIGATAKHFPGHGDTNVDSHTGLPVISHSAAQWAATDAPPFESAIATGVDVVMSAHISVPALDASGTPATLSAPILTGLLRNQMGFNGVVLTDSMDMEALRAGYTDARIPVLAIEAGADMLLNPPTLPVAYNAVLDAVTSGEISGPRLDASVRRILDLKQRLGLFVAARVNVRRARAAVGSAAHRAVERSVARASVTLLANDSGLLPLHASAGGDYLVVGPVAAAVNLLTAEIRRRGLNADAFMTGRKPSAAARAGAVARAASHDYVIVLTADADTYAAQRELVDALIATGEPTVTVSVSRPYDSASYDSGEHLCLYSASDASIRAFAEALFGEISPSGRLPVAIPSASDPGTVLFPYGFGLGYH